MSAELLDHLVVDTGSDPRHCVVWLHGLGADGHDFEPAVPALGLPEALAVRFVFPHAPVRPVTVNGGMRMRAWYDIPTLDIGGPQDEAGIRDAAERVEALMADTGFKPADTVIAGFSQGGAIALHAGLRHRHRLAGILALSCYLPLHDRLEHEAADANRDTPIFMAHGTQDPVVPFGLGQRTREFLASSGYDVAWREYAMPHAVSPEELQDIGRWLADRFR